jgi:hypothetical protein
LKDGQEPLIAINIFLIGNTHLSSSLFYTFHHSMEMVYLFSRLYGGYQYNYQATNSLLKRVTLNKKTVTGIRGNYL